MLIMGHDVIFSLRDMDRLQQYIESKEFDDSCKEEGLNKESIPIQNIFIMMLMNEGKDFGLC